MSGVKSQKRELACLADSQEVLLDGEGNMAGGRRADSSKHENQVVQDLEYIS